MKITIEAEYDGPYSVNDDLSVLRSAIDVAVSRTVGEHPERGELIRYAIRNGQHGSRLGYLTLENPE